MRRREHSEAGQFAEDDYWLHGGLALTLAGLCRYYLFREWKSCATWLAPRAGADEHDFTHKRRRPAAGSSRPRLARDSPPVSPPDLAEVGPGRCARPLDFPFHLGTIEPPGLALVSRLVTESQQFPGPILEIGTLFGRTTTHMALFKGAGQKIVTVDDYAWNPWGLSSECHYELTSRILHYLCQTEQVDQVRMSTREFCTTYRGPSPSLVFLDTNHAYEDTRENIAWARSVGAALIAGHDYADMFPGIQQAVQESGGPRELGGTVWVLGR